MAVDMALKFSKLVEDKNLAFLDEMGGIEGLCVSLSTNMDRGLANEREAILKQVSLYGNNSFPEKAETSYLQFLLKALKDKTLIVLLIAAMIETANGTYKFLSPSARGTELVNGIAILAVVAIVVNIGALADYRKQSQFKSLMKFGQSLNTINIIRGGQLLRLAKEEIVVGDIVQIEAGMVVPADGILFYCYSVVADESSMTGESAGVNKDLCRDPFLISGTMIITGVGKMLVVATGINSLSGKLLLALDVKVEDTPLQAKLSVFSELIAKIAFYLAAGIFGIFVAAYFIANPNVNDPQKIASDLLSFVLLIITIVVVVVPEGLPLAVNLSLGHATVQMLKKNNLVRHFSACETMGNATTICSDKTGTLTLNQMTVVEAVIMDSRVDCKLPSIFIEDMDKTTSIRSLEALKFVADSIKCNSTVENFVKAGGEKIMQGSKTEIALLTFTESLMSSFAPQKYDINVITIVPFSSDSKLMGCVVDTTISQELKTEFRAISDTYYFVKGASEIVLESCSRLLVANGTVLPFTFECKKRYLNLLNSFAIKSLRTIACAFIPGGKEESHDLILMGIFGIMDPIRPEVPKAVLDCQKAGVLVRMVTGDSIETAKAVAKECGILTPDGLVMEGSEFRTLSDAHRLEIIPRLQVLARSSPTDKQIMVRSLKSLGETVAVTGDGTNDGPALTSADVGFAMGISGTDVAKESCDIILMDDNFASIVHAIIWGRSVYDAIRKFIQFQVTVSVSAVAIAIVSTISSILMGDRPPQSILTALHLLWVNLIMNALAALAFATETPSNSLLERKPGRKSEEIVSSSMMYQIAGQSTYQIVVCLTLFFAGPVFWWPPGELLMDEPYTGYVTATFIFNTFVFCQIFNEFNCRSITSDIHIFKGLKNNPLFLFFIFMSVLGQVLMVQYGSIVTTLAREGLSGVNWAISIILGFGSLVVGFSIRVLSTEH